MDRKILLPTDFSNNALNAIEYALDLHKKQKCVFYFLNAFHANKKPTDIAMLIPEPGNKEYDAAKKASEDGLSNLLHTLNLRPENPKHSYQRISSYSSLLFALKDAITKKKIDIVVMGTKGTSDEEETISVMEFITECPILVVPGDYRFSGLKKIVFPTDYETAFNEEKLKYMLEIAKLHKSEINILYTKKDSELDGTQEKNRELLESIFKGMAYSFHMLADTGVSKGIHSFIESEACNLIVFVEEKFNSYGNELPKPLMKEIESHLIIPVLAVNPIK